MKKLLPLILLLFLFYDSYSKIAENFKENISNGLFHIKLFSFTN